MLYIIIFFLMGIFLIFLELYLPGGIMGTIGTLLILASMIYSTRTLPRQAPFIITGELLVSGILILVGIKAFHTLPWGKRFILEEKETGEKGFTAQPEELEKLLNKEGVTLSYLRPSGIALIDGKRVDVVSEGVFIPKGRKIKVIQVDGNRAVVKEIT